MFFASISLFWGISFHVNKISFHFHSEFFFFSFSRPGFKTKPVETDMDLSYDEKFPDVKLPDAYTRLILDVLRGEQATFVRGDELEAAWAIFTPLLNRIENEKIKPFNYKFGSRGPRQADEMMKMYYERSEDYMYKGRQYGSSSIDMTEASNL